MNWSTNTQGFTGADASVVTEFNPGLNTSGLSGRLFLLATPTLGSNLGQVPGYSVQQCDAARTQQPGYFDRKIRIESVRTFS